MKKRVLLGASYSVIEPLGLLHLSGLARDEGYDRQISLVKDHDFSDFFDQVKEFKPDIIGFNVYTGNHTQLAEAYNKIKKDHPNIQTVVGGPHPTYFPAESLNYTDYVVMSEGFGAFRRILKGEVKPGIIPMSGSEEFPHPDREVFYAAFPEHAKSNIKSIISMTGCPYTCTYCYNSSKIEDLAENLPPEVAQALGKALGTSGRLFPKNIRNIDNVIAEGRELAEAGNTGVIYFQDDVFGFDARPGGMLEQMADRWPKEVGIPFHAQMRWEMTIKEAGERRLDLIRQAGGFGLTLAIEAADYHLRKEVLDRAMPEETMIEGMGNVISRGFKVRTEQITGLPYGATSLKTKMNIDADLELVELNVKLKKVAGGPTMAWASTFAPYTGTKLGTYSQVNGHYKTQNNSDVPDTFFEKSVLRFPKEWVGPSLASRKDDDSIWLGKEDLELYRAQNAELRRIFNFVTLVPEGHLLAESYLKSTEPFSFDRLGRETEQHLSELSNENLEAKALRDNISKVRSFIDSSEIKDKNIEGLSDLAPLFATIPEFEKAVERAVKYAKNSGGELSPQLLSTAIRHHLYDEVLYNTGSSNKTRVQDPNTSRQAMLKL